MPKEQSPGNPTTRRYTPEEKALQCGWSRALRDELGIDHGTVQRVARQLGYGESVRSWAAKLTSTMATLPGSAPQSLRGSRISSRRSENSRATRF